MSFSDCVRWSSVFRVSYQVLYILILSRLLLVAAVSDQSIQKSLFATSPEPYATESTTHSVFSRSEPLGVVNFGLGDDFRNGW